MLINTRVFGLKEVDLSKVITFPNGIPGFKECKKFQLLHETGKKTMVYYLQSIDEPGLSFNLVKAESIGINFEVDLTDAEVELLSAESTDGIALLLLVSKSDEIQGPNIIPHINCPIVINTKTRRGLQKILTTPDYEINITAVLKE